ncbi:DUF1153 domain-containing protein [Sagittula salina]|uniref:DUF1153 domain-containing protein n=1 Tax=Sagittula salina TaxID=2820268 RepID=UPI001FD727CB|nr:DUF1153 domain-containing protein [Sagittula salina]
MSMTMDDSIKRWTAKRKTALVIEIIQGKTTVAKASRSFGLTPSEIEGWPDAAALCGGYTASGQLPWRQKGSFLDADRGSIFDAD